MTITDRIAFLFRGKLPSKAFLCVLILVVTKRDCFGQAPNISYQTPRIFTVNTAITTLSPKNTGGAIASGSDANISTFAGNGTSGFLNGQGTNAQISVPLGVATDKLGNVYISDSFNHTIRKVTPSGTVTTLAGNGTAGSNDGLGPLATFNTPQGLTVDDQGNCYVVDLGSKKIRKIDPFGNVSTFVTLPASSDPISIAIDASGNLYVTENFRHDIKKITPSGVISTFAGSGAMGNADGVGTAASFKYPYHITISRDGTLYVANAAGYNIRKITTAGVVTTFAGSSVAGNADGLGTSASFSFPTGIAADKYGNIYVADRGGQTIRKISPAGLVTTIAGNGVAGFADGAGSNAQFDWPHAIAVDPSGNIYVGDYNNHAVRKLEIKGGYTIDKPLPAGLTFDPLTGEITGTPTTVSPETSYSINATNASGNNTTSLKITVNAAAVQPPTQPNISYDSPKSYDLNIPIPPLQPRNFGGDPVPPTLYGQVSTFATGTPFNAPQALARDVSGNIYVLEPGKKVIWKTTPAGVTTIFAGILNTPGNTDGPLGTATFTSPAAAVFDSQGNMFVSDNVSNLIRKIAPDGTVSTFAGDGIPGLTNNLVGALARFKNPFGLAVDIADNIYVADAGNNVVRRITTTGEVMTFSGSIAGQPGTADGIATTARFASPKYITIDELGNLFVSGTANNHIRKVTFTGSVSTIAGSAPGVPVALRNVSPSGLTVTSNGDLFFADFGKHQILKLTSGGELVIIAGSGTGGSSDGIGTAATFNKPQDVKFDNDGNLYVADQVNNLIRKIVLTGYTIDMPPPSGITFDPTTGIFSGTPTMASPPTDYTVTAYNAGGPSVPVKVNITVNPPPAPTKPNISYATPQSYTLNKAITPLTPNNTGGAVPAQIYGEKSPVITGSGYMMTLTADRFGSVYAAEWNLNSIRKISVSPSEIIAGSTGGAVGYTDGKGAEALFSRPLGIVSDANGNMYVAEEGNNKIRKISGSAPYTVSTLGVTGLLEPNGLTLDPSGSYLYVADRGHSLIKKIDLQTDAVSTVNTGALDRPSGVDVDAQGNLYIADSRNNAIKKVSSIGLVTTLASGLNNPREVRIDQAGNIYFTDQLNDAVKRIAPDGTITSLVSGILNPIGLALDGRGNLYVAGINNKEVIKVSVSGYVLDKPLPAGLTFDQKTGIISGTPTVIWPLTTYNITAYNGGGSSTAQVEIEVTTSSLTPQVLTFAAITPKLICSPPFSVAVSSTNVNLPIKYLSSNPSVATVDANSGLVTLKGITGTTNITASQAGDATYADATPKTQQLIVNSPAVPSVVINTNVSNVCIDEPVTFTADVSNLTVLVNPAYQWLRNGIQVGTGPTYSTLVTAADKIKCIVTNNDICVLSGEDEITNVSPKAKVSLTLTISSSATGAVCEGTSITFTAEPNYDNNQNHYQWQVNGINMPGDNKTFSSKEFKNGDEIGCMFTNNTATCVLSFSATAAPKTVQIIAANSVAPTVTIKASASNVYAEQPVTFTATTANTTGAVKYQWLINGAIAGTNSATFTSATLKNADKITCTIEAGNCDAPATSNEIFMTVLPPLLIEPSNTFTPNADGINDLWLISGLSTYPNCLVNVYSRSGQNVFKSKGYSQPWDGFYRSKNLSAGTYYYVIDLANGRPKISGYLTLIR